MPPSISSDTITTDSIHTDTIGRNINMMECMNIFGYVRKRLALNPYGMSKAMGLGQTAYVRLEDGVKLTKIETIVKLSALASQAGISSEQFLRLLRKDTSNSAE